MEYEKPFTITLPQSSDGRPERPSNVKVRAYIHDNSLTVVNLPRHSVVAYAFRETCKGEHRYYILYYDKGHIVAKDPLTGLVLLIGTIDELLQANIIHTDPDTDAFRLRIAYRESKNSKEVRPIEEILIPLSLLPVPIGLVVDTRILKQSPNEPGKAQELELIWPPKEHIERLRWDLQQLSPLTLGNPFIDKTKRVGKETKRKTEKQTKKERRTP
jgi:hypothetical protein